MKIILYGTNDDGLMLKKLIGGCKDFFYRTVQLDNFEDYDIFIRELEEHNYDAVFVTMPKSAGLEGVTAARTLKKEVPRVWISDDRGFGPQAFRLGAAYFTDFPMTHDKIEAALLRCRI